MNVLKKIFTNFSYKTKFIGITSTSFSILFATSIYINCLNKTSILPLKYYDDCENNALSGTDNIITLLIL